MTNEEMEESGCCLLSIKDQHLFFFYVLSISVRRELEDSADSPSATHTPKKLQADPITQGPVKVLSAQQSMGFYRCLICREGLWTSCRHQTRLVSAFQCKIFFSASYHSAKASVKKFSGQAEFIQVTTKSITLCSR